MASNSNGKSTDEQDVAEVKKALATGQAKDSNTSSSRLQCVLARRESYSYIYSPSHCVLLPRLNSDDRCQQSAFTTYLAHCRLTLLPVRRIRGSLFNEFPTTMYTIRRLRVVRDPSKENRSDFV
jgi:hypothetical protein